MAELKLTFAAVLQSWGMEEHYTGSRRTELSPTHSAICGLIANAMGLCREDEKEIQNIMDRIRIASVKHENAIKKITDDQIIGTNGGRIETANGKTKKEKDNKFPLVKKEYIQDNIYEIVLEGDEEIIKMAKEALTYPKRPPHLGRKCCTGYEYVLQEV